MLLDFVRTFTLQKTGCEPNILWENDDPLFRVDEMVKVLELTKTRSIIKTFDNTELVVRNVATDEGIKEIKFLTEGALCTLIFNSNGVYVKDIQNKILDAMVSIRKTGKFEL